MKSEDLPLTGAIDDLLADGKIAEAKRVHEAHVDGELARAKAGATINLTDLFASRDQIIIAETTTKGEG